MVLVDAYTGTSSDEGEDDTMVQPRAPRSKPAPAPAPAPEPAPAPVKKKKTLNRQAIVSNKDPDAAPNTTAPAEAPGAAPEAPLAAAPPPAHAPAEKKKKTPVAADDAAAVPTPALQAKKRDVVAGGEVVTSKSPLVSARSGSGDEDEDDAGDGDDATPAGIFVGVGSGRSKTSKTTKPVTVADEAESEEDEDEDDDNNEFGDSVSARTEEPKAATPTPHPKPQQPTASAADSAKAPVVGKTEEFLTELLEDVQFLTRGKKKKPSQRIHLFNFSEHLFEESLELTKAEFALDPAVPVELAGALTTDNDDDDGQRKTIKPIDMPFDVFLSGDEDKFFTSLCEQDPWGRQKLMAASIIATKESEAPKQFCYFMRLNITAPREPEEGAEPNAEAVAAWPPFETFMGEEKREVVLSVSETVVKAAMVKQLQDAVFFCPQQFISVYTPTKPRGRSKAATTAEPVAKSHVYKRFEQVNEKVVPYAYNITGGPVPRKRSASASTKSAAAPAPAAAGTGPKQKTLAQIANKQAENASKQGRRLPIAHKDDDEDDGEEEEEDDDEGCQRPPPAKKPKSAPLPPEVAAAPAPEPSTPVAPVSAPVVAPVAAAAAHSADDDVRMNDGDKEDDSDDDDGDTDELHQCDISIAHLANEIYNKKKTMKLLEKFRKYLASRR